MPLYISYNVTFSVGTVYAFTQSEQKSINTANKQKGKLTQSRWQWMSATMISSAVRSGQKRSVRQAWSTFINITKEALL